MKLFLIALLLLSACKKSEKEDSRLPEDVNLKEKYDFLVDRFVSLSDEGWVVARKKDDPTSLDKLGDSLIWTGISLAGLPCEDSKKILEILSQEAEKRSGALPRHYSFEKETNTIDGYVGLHYGLVRYVKKCKDRPLAEKLYSLTRDAYKSMLTESLGYVIDRGDAFFTENIVQQTVDVAFDASILAWAVGVVKGKQPCYKLHLATLMAAFVEETGASVNDAEFCSVSKKADLPFTDAYCGRRKEAKKFLINFKENIWENRNQRCPAWESENNGGLEIPGIDFLQTYDYTF